jgi:hypothetical protein
MRKKIGSQVHILINICSNAQHYPLTMTINPSKLEPIAAARESQSERFASLGKGHRQGGRAVTYEPYITDMGRRPPGAGHEQPELRIKRDMSVSRLREP